MQGRAALGRPFSALAGMALLLYGGFTPVLAQRPVVEEWYAALAVADRSKLESLLAPNARIRLGDLGIEQTKAEFVDSLDEWEAAVKGATIRHRIESGDGAVTTVIACYDFPANDVLLRENFRIEAGLILENSQDAIAESCESY
ncbi:nuclear transport factor 2 family protein [Mesorhizobium sp. CN2-181]|uniref:nuclear transport factor 2 family protein n=1 Tax=Mesorhizobium yinganensis TaxID=3157707 RepID=UPI0032B7B443